MTRDSLRDLPILTDVVELHATGSFPKPQHEPEPSTPYSSGILSENDVAALQAILVSRMMNLTDELLQRMISSLCEMNILQRSESGAWLLSRDLDTVSLGELYEGMEMRIPANEVPLPSRHDAIGRASRSALDHLRLSLQAPLQRNVGSFLKNTDQQES